MVGARLNYYIKCQCIICLYILIVILNKKMALIISCHPPKSIICPSNYSRFVTTPKYSRFVTNLKQHLFSSEVS